MSKDETLRILLVDDVPSNLQVLSETLEEQGYVILMAPSGEVCLKIARQAKPDLILLDVMMPEMDGFETCHHLKQSDETHQIPVIFITAREETEAIIEGFNAGGVNYITKPFDAREVLVRVETHLKISCLTRQLARQNAELAAANERLHQEIQRRQQAEDALTHFNEQEASRWGIEGFVGRSEMVEKIVSEIQQIQNVDRTNVLILGESGTGKELIARAIHFGSPRAKKPFIPVNCAAIPKDLVASTLFGHLRGAFTGAHTSHKGVFELATGGTLFLDEIAEMPLNLQVTLLRVLEERIITPIGGTRQVPVNVRVIAATNADLEARMANSAFREDLYFRLARFIIKVPPLRKRKEDIPLLIAHFCQMFSQEMGICMGGEDLPALSDTALEALMNYHFPGNVRELKNIVENAMIRSGGKLIQIEHLQLMDLRQHHAVPAFAEEQLAVDRIPVSSPVFKRLTAFLDQPLRPETDEDLVAAYVIRHGSINNSECQRLLDVDKHRANYLLNKLCRTGRLKRVGRSRSTRYVYA